MPRPPTKVLPSAATTSCTRTRRHPFLAPRSRRQSFSLVLGVTRVFFLIFGICLGAGVDRRARELGVGLRLVGAVAEPDVARNDRIAGHDLAFAVGEIADHPEVAIVGQTDAS